MSEGPLLSVRDLAVDFAVDGGVFEAVRGIGFDLARGESLAIIGESGSGKSVTASAILNLIDQPPGRIRSGSICLEGRELVGAPRSLRRAVYGAEVAVIFQDPLSHLNPVRPVGWQVAEVCRIHGWGRARARARAQELLERVGIPDASRRMDEYPHQFSGGQRQRIMIAMSMALSPKLLIADEPTTALDVTVQAQILDLIRELQAETGMALLMITHDLGVAADIASRVLVMKDGAFVEEGPVAEVLLSPRHPYTRALVAAGARPRADRAAPGPPILSAEGIEMRYGDAVGVRDAGFELRRGEVLCVVGESGSGKSTLAAAILQLRAPARGVIRFHGEALGDMDAAGRRAYRRAVQAVFQDPFSSLNPRMTVLEVISEPWVIQRGVLPRARWRARAAELMEAVGLDPAGLCKHPTDFSGGQRQRIAIARALALDSEVIVCDEAVSALDKSVQAQVIELLGRLGAELGVALIFICHDLELVRSFADTVLVMRGGRIVEQGPAEELFAAPREAYTRRLIAASPVMDPEAQASRRRELRALGGA